MMQQELELLQKELEEELQNILRYWMHTAVDNRHGGFLGSVDHHNNPVSGAPKGIVLNARILWTFSAAYRHTKDTALLHIAERAFAYIIHHFNDEVYGGVYWSVDENGIMSEGRKQVYGLAFCIYGCSAYAAAGNNTAALDYAIQLYKLVEQYSYDPVNNGYIEAFTREWAPLEDVRLSAKDVNAKKTMNTHLHIIEAYAALYRVWPDDILRGRIENLLSLIDTYFINHTTHHLRLFFDEHWNEQIDVISFGHDIEAAWLLLQCAEIINSIQWINKYRKHAVQLVHAAMRGLDTDGGLWYEYDKDNNQLVKEKHWWPQAEAMIGFFNAYQLTNDRTYLDYTLKSWTFIKSYLLDKQHGEWFWGVNEDYSIMSGKDKIGFWKCPYHNARACMELIRRIDSCFR